ncbi:unnamed protein product [Linum trigynum]
MGDVGSRGRLQLRLRLGLAGWAENGSRGWRLRRANFFGADDERRQTQTSLFSSARPSSSVSPRTCRA